MKYFTYFYENELEALFFQTPKDFNKYSDRELLSYGLGATLICQQLVQTFIKTSSRKNMKD
jgi:hypothetical protein